MQHIIIRPAQAVDTDGIRQLILPIQREEFGIAITWDDQPDLHNITAYYCKNAGGFWVAVADEIVGSIALIDIGNGDAVIRKMFVTAAFRGKTYNIAQQLLVQLLQHARNHNVKTLWLGTTDRYFAAHRFYERNGFVHIAVEDLPQSFPRMAVDTRFYKLILANG